MTKPPKMGYGTVVSFAPNLARGDYVAVLLSGEMLRTVSYRVMEVSPTHEALTLRPRHPQFEWLLAQWENVRWAIGDRWKAWRQYKLDQLAIRHLIAGKRHERRQRTTKAPLHWTDWE